MRAKPIPIRTPIENRIAEALCAAVADGTIDMVVSDHRPWDLEHHDVEFVLSPYGISSIESAFSVAATALGGGENDDLLTRLVAAFTTGPRAVFGLPTSTIAEGNPGELTWFHPTSCCEPTRISGGANRLVYTGELRGSVLGTFR